MKRADTEFVAPLSQVTERDKIAYHEAGHAVVMAAFDLPFRYISMQPRRTDASAHVVGTARTGAQVYERGHWRAGAAEMFAGAIVEDLWNSVYFDDYRSSLAPLRGEVRKIVVQDHARCDLRHARDLVKYAWARESYTPGWSVTPIDIMQSTPCDLAIDAWQVAVTKVAEYWSSIEIVADMLFTSTKAVTWKQVRDVVYAEGPEDGVELGLGIDHLIPWFLRYSKLQWEPSESWYAKVRKTTENYRVNEVAA
jgi:hypothetical protein